MVAPVVGTPGPPWPAGGGELVIDWRGPHAFIRHIGEPASDADVLGSVPAVPGNFLLLASPGAHREPRLLNTIRGCLASLWSLPVAVRPRAAWLAVSDLGNPHGDCAGWVHGLAAEAGITILAPHGRARALPSTGVFVDRAAGGFGWRRFTPGGGDADVVGCRFPVPSWEHWLPQIPLRAAGLVAEPIPAGLAVHVEGNVPQSHRDLAFRVPISARIPKVVLGGPGTGFPAPAVAELLALLPPDLRRQVLLVPGAVSMTRPEWVHELAVLAGHPIAASAGSQVLNPRRGIRTVVLGERGEEMSTPFATMLLQRPDADLPEVIDVAPAPLGWTWSGPRTYQPVSEPGRAGRAFPGVLVEVVPGGLAVHSAETSVVALPFDPGQWTLAVGTPGEVVSDVEVAAVRSLLDGLTTQQLRTACVRVFGILAPPVQAMLDAYVKAVGASPFVASPSPVSEAPVAVAPTPPAVVSAMPVVTVSEPERAEHQRTPSPAPLTPPREPELPEIAAVVQQPTAEPVPEAPQLPVRNRPTEPIVLADRMSTTGEQTRLTDSAGPRYTEALATVNVALSAWPMLRPEAKADYIAVCLYLGSGEGGARELNTALNDGGPIAFDGYLPCLMSGLRRLPTHRQVVLRQEGLDGGGEFPVPTGTVLTEPAFLSASVRLDVTTAAAGLDVLIWPVSARRTSELVMGRSIDEAVFPPGRRFKVLATRTQTEESTAGEDEEGPRHPRKALLARELLPAEDPRTADAEVRDTAALVRLERALAARRAAEVRVVEDPDAVARLTTPLMPAAASGQGTGVLAGGSLEMVS